MNIAHEHNKIIAVFSGNICNTEEADWRTFKEHNTLLHLKVVSQLVSPPCGAVLKSATQHKAVSSQDKVPDILATTWCLSIPGYCACRRLW